MISQNRRVLLLVFLLLILMCVALCGVGCTRTIYVPHGTPVRLRETVEDVKVWVRDADGNVVPGRMDLAEGWYALSPDTSDQG